MQLPDTIARNCLLILALAFGCLCCGCASATRAQPKPVTVVITSTPPDAVVFVDDVQQPQRTPTSLVIDPLRRPLPRVRVHAPGYREATLVLDETKSQADDNTAVQTHALQLERAGQGLRIQSRPSGAVILVDGSPRGSTGEEGPLFIPLAPGEHQLVVRSPQFPDWTTSITIEADRWLPLSADVATTFRTLVDRQLLDRVQQAELKLAAVGAATVADARGGLFVDISGQQLRERRLYDLYVNEVMMTDIVVTGFQKQAMVERGPDYQPVGLPPTPTSWQDTSHYETDKGTTRYRYHTYGVAGSAFIPELTGDLTIKLQRRDAGSPAIERRIHIRPGQIFVLRHHID